MCFGSLSREVSKKQSPSLRALTFVCGLRIIGMPPGAARESRPPPAGLLAAGALLVRPAGMVEARRGAATDWRAPGAVDCRRSTTGSSSISS